jgi:subtilisin-like proprotein convertase family protein/uncharacterized protein YvpB
MLKREKLNFLFGLPILISLIYIFASIPAAAQSEVLSSPEPTQPDGTEYKFNFPLVIVQPTPTPIPSPEGEQPKTYFCNSPSMNITDNKPDGVSDTINISDLRFIRDIDIRLDISHTWTGDLRIQLTHVNSGRSIELIDRPGSSPGGNTDGCSLNNIKAILDDDISLPVENECSSFPAAIAINNYIEAAIAGTYIPQQELASFDSEPITGDWVLTVSDHAPVDTGVLNQWCIAVELIDTPNIAPTPPPPSGLPGSASISGVTGRSQTLPLDCESRSAVDWANYFGVNINELDFFYGLPESDNPDLGFVGNVYGTWGQIPPFPYGVHAEPIAERLQEFGLEAIAHRPLSWENLKAEIAAGRPVIVWILGSKYSGYDYVVNGIPEYYRPKKGDNTVVSRYEHTVIVTGYTNESVSYLNGGNIYQKDHKQFLESWSALGNMAVTLGQ